MNAVPALDLEFIAPTGEVSQRLWRPLASPERSDPQVTGVDVFGEHVRGWMARRCSVRALRRRAEKVLDRRKALEELGERSLADAIAAARERIVLAREAPDALNEAFAVASEVVRREIGLALYPEQIMGALAMARGFLAEMATGEGKTVTAILPATVEGWSGRGVHVITVNDYLARRDAQTTGPAYRRLGLSVGVIQDQDEQRDRKRAYSCAVTYAADKQLIFDALRDGLNAPLNPRLTAHILDQLESISGGSGRTNWTREIVQRGLHAAIVDEADSVLIDEATTPAIIAADIQEEGDDRLAYFRTARDIAADLTCDEHYTVDARLKRVFLTDQGERILADAAGALPAFWSGPRRRRELITQAIAARDLFHRDDDYVVRDDEVAIVDPSTGRILEGRQWQLGLHQAIEAKEGLEVSSTRRTSARISYQRFFARYNRLAGMTGTASEVADELWRYYHLPTVRIPTHRKVIRRHPPDRIFATEHAKFEAVVGRVCALHEREQPVLVGTRSVVASERLGTLLADRGVEARILNAMREAEEAEIVADAGQPGAVTVATNMAGRGTDILLTDRTRALGGLVVLGTERHRESRVDRQLAGRAGRQGDPGVAQFYVSTEDEVIRLHGSRVLLWLLRVAPGPARRLVSSLLWRSAQWTASGKASILRSEVGRSEDWLDMALHHHSR